jgi:hypothetical protein
MKYSMESTVYVTHEVMVIQSQTLTTASKFIAWHRGVKETKDGDNVLGFPKIYSNVRLIPQVHLFSLLDHGTAPDNHVTPLVAVPVVRSLALSSQLVLAPYNSVFPGTASFHPLKQ